MNESDLCELRLLRIHIVAAQLCLGERDYLELGNRLHDAKLSAQVLIGKLERDVELEEARLEHRFNRRVR